MSFALAAMALACSGVEHRAVDLQLDLPGAPPEASEQVRLCVTGVGERVAGSRFTGRYVFTGLPAGRAADVTVDALDAEGEVLAQWSGAQVWGYAEGAQAACGAAPADTGPLDTGDTAAPVEIDCTPCAASGALAEGDTWVLGVRFLGVSG
ncbi:MAG: hypothetical protein H6741_16860 [Alphaproteobacteria bacterium]|nr:hypothetical protein [Alphaproteobacteria bacterium]